MPTYNFKIQDKVRNYNILTRKVSNPTVTSYTVPLGSTSFMVNNSNGFEVGFQIGITSPVGDKSVVNLGSNTVIYYIGTAILTFTVPVVINDVATNLKINEFNTTERLDEALDDGMAIEIPSTKQDTYKIFDTFVATVDGEVIKQTIASDIVRVRSKNPIITEHTLKLVELTKKWERIMCSSLGFTQPLSGIPRYTLYDFFERVRRTQPLRTVSNDYSPFLIPNSLKAQLENITLPQFFISRRNLREMLNVGASVLDAIARCNNFDELELDYFNKVKESIVLSLNNIDRNAQQDYKLYASSSESYLENARIEGRSAQAVISFPANGYITPRSQDIQLTETNAVYELPFPIDRIYKGYTYILDEFDQPYDLDITNFIFEFDAWKTLPTQAPSPATQKTQQNTIYYRYKDNKIVLGNAYGAILATTVMVRLIEGAIAESGLFVTPITNNVFDIMCRFEYRPVYKGRLNTVKGSVDNVDKYGVITINQEEPIINARNFLDSTYSKLKRMGNMDITFSQFVKSRSEAFEIGDFDSNGYIINRREFAHRNDHIIVRYEATKDFNRLNKRIAVNSEFRAKEVTPEIINRDLQYSQFVELDSVPNYDSSCFITQYGANVFMNTFRVTGAIYQELKAVRPKLCSYFSQELSGFPSLTYRPSQDVSFRTLLTSHIGLGLSNFYGGGAINFVWNFFDNYTAGNYRVSIPTGLGVNSVVNRALKYKKEDGTLNEFSFALYEKMNQDAVIDDYTTSLQNARADLYPAIENPASFGLQPLFSTDNFDALLDPSEVVTFAYQLHLVSVKDKIIAYKDIMDFNNLLVERPANPDNNIRLYFSEEEYTKTDTTPKGQVNSGLYVLNASLSNCFIGINSEILPIPSNYKSWALGDTKGRLYFACNDITITKVYFNFRGSRSDIRYVY